MKAVQTGLINEMTVNRLTSVGAYLDDGDKGILLPGKYLPEGLKAGDKLNVFIYHDSEDRIIATTETPKAKLGEIAMLRVVSATPQGAFLDWGLTKDLFVPRSKQLGVMKPNGYYIVRVYMDEQTGRLAATEKIEPFLSNDNLTVKEMETVKLLVYRRTDIGYVVIINDRHTGVLHFNEIYRPIREGDTFTGFIKKIYPDNKIDVAAGKPGYARVEDESEKIIRLLKENDRYLPFHDKSDPQEIYDFFEMSKKTFKMTLGKLYKDGKISLEKTGIRLIEN